MPLTWFNRSIIFQDPKMYSPSLMFQKSLLENSVHFVWSRTPVLDQPAWDFQVCELFLTSNTKKILNSQKTVHQLLTRTGFHCQALTFQDLCLLMGLTLHPIGIFVFFMDSHLWTFVKVFKVPGEARPIIQKIFSLDNTQGSKGNCQESNWYNFFAFQTI